ncbi:uncharacterized protein K441DRAFT_538868 [Cenococcum geophilum 1.58]|uniref:uncharacterized protein n=1 Tax=Cenococcum geophilum 1.58 TaxID=794803 RepID=UPI00358F3A38|nr:hypothetical protein K441DRAFT_538868 [Cenococcum geophilum 1.58]
MSSADTCNCVASITSSFANGLDIFKRLRERRRKKKTKRVRTQPDPKSGNELKLGNSLRRGPAEIQTHYERNYGAAGERFAKGDAIAHASLAETLLKLNTGLVGIIASFLNQDRKDLHLDYKSLTNLSDASRVEAIDTLNQLYQRLSQSNVALYQPNLGCPHCGSLKHARCGAVSTRNTSTDRHSNGKKPRKRQTGGKAASSRSHSNTPTIARVPGKSSSQTQLVVMRPRNRRTTSSSSTSSSGGSTRSPSTASTVVTTPHSSPLTSPNYTTINPFQYQAPFAPKAGNFRPLAAPKRKPPPIPSQRPQTWPHGKPDSSNAPAMPKLPITSTSHQTPQPSEKQQLVPSTGLALGPTSVPRRLDKATPSAYSFASDSTKLGEIPMRKWTTPYDFEAMDRLNAEALANGWVPGMPEPPKEKPKRKLFGFLRKSEAGPS